ncbi:MAG: hypothetical protein K0S76_3078 [Herbinix sp.]|jgi:hypothetical protein|nr:hypothetical protein [Herbinix sp.]
MLNLKIKSYLLGLFDLFLAWGAIYYGVLMIQQKAVMFEEYPQEWLTKVPFTSWVAPGIIAITVYGFGNLMAAVFSFFNINNKPWLASAVMGGFLLFSLIVQGFLFGEIYLPTIYFYLFSFIQLIMSASLYRSVRKNSDKILLTK